MQRALSPSTLARLAALRELHRRILGELPPAGTLISGPADAAALFAHLAGLEHEEMHVAYLSTANRVLAIEAVAVGGLAQMHVTPHQVFRPALKHNAAGLILGHNHPSGSLEPSVADRMLTKHLVASGEQLGLRVLDHIVVAAGGQTFSFAESGCMSTGD